METKVISCSYFVNNEIEKVRFGVANSFVTSKSETKTNSQKAIFVSFKQAIAVLKRCVDIFIYDDICNYLENAKSYQQICDLFVGCNIVVTESVESVNVQENDKVTKVDYYNYTLESIVISDNTLKLLASFVYYGSLSEEERRNVNRAEVKEKINKYIEENRAE